MSNLKYACKYTGKIIIYAISFQYWLSEDNHDKTNELNSKKSPKNRKLKYYLTKLMRAYGYKYIFEGDSKYFEFLLKTLKSLTGLQEIKKVNEKMIIKKLETHIRCNL